MTDLVSTGSFNDSGELGYNRIDGNSFGENFKAFLRWLIDEQVLNDKISNPTCYNSPLFVFVSKKGYWIYRLVEERLRQEDIFSWQDRIAKGEIEAKSDRFFTKMISGDQFPEILKHRLIYVVDDFLIRGENIARFCRLIRDKAFESIIIPVVFAKWVGFQPVDDVPEFGRLRSFPNANETMTLGEIGRLSAWETEQFYDSGIPYVIDLPFLKVNNNISHDKLGAFFSGALTQSQFDCLCNANDSMWSVEDDSCVIAGFEIKSKFFYFRYDPFQNKFRNLIQNLVVKCQYKNDPQNGTVLVTFTPFAIMRSVRQDELIEIFKSIYEGTEYGKLLGKKIKFDYGRSLDECLNTAIYRSVVFFLSRYISINFKILLQQKIGVDLELRNDELKNHWPTEFIESLPIIFSESFLLRLDRLYAQNDITPYLPQITNVARRQSISMYFDIFSYFAIYKKMDDSERSFCSIDELEGEMAAYRGYSSDNAEFKLEFTKALLQLLNQGVISNHLSYDEDTGYICRGFRAGENSTLLLPFNQKAVFSVIYNFYKMCGGSDNSNEGTAFQITFRNFKKNYPKFKSSLLKFIKEAELDSYLDIGEANDILSYFGMMSENVLKQQIENRSYIIEDMEGSKSTDSVLARIFYDYISRVPFEWELKPSIKSET